MAEIYVPGGFDFMAAGNALSQMQSGIQARQSNALQMQYAAEDRAREAENRKIAAGNALAARAEAQKIAKIYEQGFNPGQTALMTPSIAPGPGVVRQAVEPSYDYTKTALEFLKIGKTDKAKELFGLPEARREANAKGIEGDAKAQLAVLETSAKAYTTALANVKPVLDQAISIDGLLHYVDVVDADPLLRPLAIKTGGPTEARKEAIRKMAAPKEAGGGGMTVDQIAKRLSGVSGYDLAGMDIELRKKEADVAKTEAETANVGKPTTPSSTEKERAFAILAQGTVNPSIVNTPAYRAALAIASQSEIKAVTGPNGEVKYVSVAPSLPSWVVLPKENAAVAPQAFGDAVAQRQASAPDAFTNALNQAGGAAPQVNNLVAPPAAASATAPATAPAVSPSNNKPDANVRAYDQVDTNGDVRVFNKYGEQIAFNPSAGKPSTEEEKRRVANQQLALTINELEEILKPGGLIEKATGSGIGAGRDYAAGIFGITTEGAAAIAALKPIYDMVLKTVPRFEGPQSDKDIISYNDAAGRLADPTATLGEKQAAAKTILRLMKLRADQFNIAPAKANTSASGGDVDSSNPLLK